MECQVPLYLLKTYNGLPGQDVKLTELFKKIEEKKKTLEKEKSNLNRNSGGKGVVQQHEIESVTSVSCTSALLQCSICCQLVSSEQATLMFLDKKLTDFGRAFNLILNMSKSPIVTNYSCQDCADQVLKIFKSVVNLNMSTMLTSRLLTSKNEEPLYDRCSFCGVVCPTLQELTDHFILHVLKIREKESHDPKSGKNDMSKVPSRLGCKRSKRGSSPDVSSHESNSEADDAISAEILLGVPPSHKRLSLYEMENEKFLNQRSGSDCSTKKEKSSQNSPKNMEYFHEAQNEYNQVSRLNDFQANQHVKVELSETQDGDHRVAGLMDLNGSQNLKSKAESSEVTQINASKISQLSFNDCLEASDVSECQTNFDNVLGGAAVTKNLRASSLKNVCQTVILPGKSKENSTENFDENKKLIQSGCDTSEDEIIKLPKKSMRKLSIKGEDRFVGKSRKKRRIQEGKEKRNAGKQEEKLNKMEENSVSEAVLPLCHVCGKGYSSIETLKVHLKRHDPNYKDPPRKRYREIGSRLCDLCGKSFKTNEILRSHLKKHETACSICGKNMWRKSLKKHMLVKHIMPKDGGQRPTMGKPRRPRTQPKYRLGDPLHCNQCDKTYPDKFLLINHIAAIHGGNLDRGGGSQDLKCPKCGLSFSSGPKLRNHRLEQHGDSSVDQYQCEVCKKWYRDRAFLRKHMRIQHLDAPRFACKLCTKTFKYGGGLYKHVNQEHDRRSFECEICPNPKPYRQRFQIVNHLNKHVRSGDTTLECASARLVNKDIDSGIVQTQLIYLNDLLLQYKND